MRNFSLIFILLLALGGSCVNPLDINTDEEVNVLIVEASIITGLGPQRIRLTQSSKYGSILAGSIRPIYGATIIIRDNEGKNNPLSEVTFSYYEPFRPDSLYYQAGVYTTTDDFSALAGKTYTLLITTANGIEYTSLPETIIPVTEILGLSAEFTKIALGDNKFKTGFNVYATFQDSPEEQNFYMWKNNGTFKTLTYPFLHVIYPPIGPAIPDPKDCCRNCWVTELSADRSLHLLSDKNVNGNIVMEHVAFIEDDRVRFTDKYLVRIEAHSLNRETYQFFKLLQDQLSINGDIFDPPPATLRGNMINLTNPDENVIGYFRCSDVAIDSMFLTREMLLEPRALLSINDDCREYKNGTTEKPEYW